GASPGRVGGATYSGGGRTQRRATGGCSRLVWARSAAFPPLPRHAPPLPLAQVSVALLGRADVALRDVALAGGAIEIDEIGLAGTRRRQLARVGDRVRAGEHPMIASLARTEIGAIELVIVLEANLQRLALIGIARVHAVVEIEHPVGMRGGVGAGEAEPGQDDDRKQTHDPIPAAARPIV